MKGMDTSENMDFNAGTLTILACSFFQRLMPARDVDFNLCWLNLYS